RWSLSLLCFAVVSIWSFFPYSALGADIQSRLAAGEIIYRTLATPGSGLKKGEATGVVDAPPAQVWQVVTDVNNYQEFLPRMLRSRLVQLEELRTVLEAQPGSAAAVEALLSSSPGELAAIRVPGGKYRGYFYGHLEVPFPLRDRWYIVRVLWDESHAERQVYTCSWSLMEGNLREYYGDWKVEPFGAHRTLLTYRAATDPGGFAPRFLVEEFSTKTLPQVIAGVRKRLAAR
ncbi:MAG: SRPBCC family protein, partial [Syntrophales bacterium]|nr:SRPBCC family protein [Syntrophales bacterium]